jgi:hypothetical protein
VAPRLRLLPRIGEAIGARAPRADTIGETVEIEEERAAIQKACSPDARKSDSDTPMRPHPIHVIAQLDAWRCEKSIKAALTRDEVRTTCRPHVICTPV